MAIPGYPAWFYGFIAGFGVVAIVVVVVAVILTYASRISEQADQAIVALERSRRSTLPLWAVQEIDEAGVAILHVAQALRAALEAQLR